MHPLHDYIAELLARKLVEHRIVVWYDPRRELAPFIDELRALPVTRARARPVTVAGVGAHFAEHDGSFFEVRAAVEPLVKDDVPEPVLIYVPGCTADEKTSVLLELEKAGTVITRWTLRSLARTVLQRRYTDGVIDERLRSDAVTYQDLAHLASEDSSTEPASILKPIYRDTASRESLIASWLASDGRDADIDAKGASAELVKLLRSHLGLELPTEASLARLRATTLRYVLASEFRSDLQCAPPAGLNSVPAPKNARELTALRELAARLRSSYSEAYTEIADRLERELGLREATLPPEALGAIDTFRFEERALLVHCAALVRARRFDEALSLVSERERSFWLDRDVARKAHWEAYRRMAELGRWAVRVRAELPASGDPREWIEAYTKPEGWYGLDQAQRHLETWITSLEEDADEAALELVRRAYEDACHAMAEGFTRALVTSGWNVAGPLHQTRLYSEVVAQRPKPVAYFLVDAMRFEMGVELARRLPASAEVSVRPVVAALPSITPIGMAALQAGASSSFDVVEQGGTLGSRIEGTFLPDLRARQKWAESRIPQLADMTLDHLLSLRGSKLDKTLAGKQVIIVRSGEIDRAGETDGSFQARRVMDTVIDNLVRAIRKLASAGVAHTVVSADHGHLFASERDTSMRTDAPGGQTIELHRRCWIGRGGSTPPGCVRVAASALGYTSDLDLVFPSGAGVFKAGGDLAFHHGGPSLQELIVPLVTVRLVQRASQPPRESPATISGVPDKITNRMVAFVVTTMIGGTFQPVLLSDGRKVGSLYGVVGGASFDREAGTITLEPSSSATVALLLADDGVKKLRVVLLDPATDAEIDKSRSDLEVDLLGA